jgi:hypothetical protein
MNTDPHGYRYEPPLPTLPIVRQNNVTGDTISRPIRPCIDPQSYSTLFPAGRLSKSSRGSIYFVGGNDRRLGPHDQISRAEYIDISSFRQKPWPKPIAALLFCAVSWDTRVGCVTYSNLRGDYVPPQGDSEQTWVLNGQVMVCARSRLLKNYSRE